MKKNFEGMRSLHAIEVSNQVLETLEGSSENVTQVQEMTLALLMDIMFNTAMLVDMKFSDKYIERGYHDNQGNKQDDRRTP